MTQKQDLQRKMISTLGGGVAVADDFSQMQMPSPGQPQPPNKAIPEERYAADVAAFEKTNKCRFVGQHESDPSFLVFQDSDGNNFKLKADTFLSGFRGTEQGKTY